MLRPINGEITITKGTTLMELLSVCACLLVIGSVIVDSIQTGRDYALRTACAARLRQVGVGFNNYSSDNYGFLPQYQAGDGLGDLDNWKDLFSFSDPEGFFFSTAVIMPFGYRQGNMTFDPRVPRLLTEYTNSIEVLCCNAQGPTTY